MTRRGDTTPPETRFWKKVEKRGEDDCWIWIGAGSNGRGYGRFRVGTKGVPMVGPHRFSLELSGVHVPDDAFVLHSCDNPRCVNPKHLRVGTPKDNTLDAMAKGRMKRLFSPGFDERRRKGL